MAVDTFPAPRPLPAPTALTARLRRLAELTASPSRWVVVLVLGVLVLVSFALRIRQIHFHLWIDEGLSVGIASHPLSRIPTVLRQDGSPPLYYLLLHIWMSLRGHGVLALHELSLIFALLTVPVAYWAAAGLWDRRAGLVAGALAAGTPYLDVYATETRMYALVALLSILVAAGFVQAFVRRRRRYLGLFSISLAATMYAHNWGLFLGLMTAAAFVLCVRETPALERRALWRDGAIAFGLVALLYLPWLPTLIYQATHTGAPWDLPPVFWSLTQSFYALTGGRGAAVALLFGIGAGLWATRRAVAGRLRLPLSVECLLLLALGTLLVAWAYSKISPAWAFRYLAVLVGPLVLLASRGLTRAGRAGLVALVLVLGFWVLDPVSSFRDAKSNVATVTHQVRNQLGSDPLVLSTQPEQVATIAYYLPRVRRFATPIGPVPDPGVFDWRDALAKLRRSSVRRVLMPLVAGVPAGGRILLIVPVKAPKLPLWLTLIGRDSVSWARALNHDHALVRLRETDLGSAGSALGVRALLYEKRA